MENYDVIAKHSRNYSVAHIWSWQHCLSKWFGAVKGNIPLRPKLPEPMLTQIHVAIWCYWQNELISVILKMHNHSLSTHWGRDKMAAILPYCKRHVLLYKVICPLNWWERTRPVVLSPLNRDKTTATWQTKYSNSLQCMTYLNFNQNSFRICPKRSI